MKDRMRALVSPTRGAFLVAAGALFVLGCLPTIDPTTIPTGSAGYSTVRIQTTTELPGPSDGTGAFRTVCDLSHMKKDDPLVYPNQPGASHLHAFFGNTLTSATSTQTSIETTGSSTCRGGIANRSAYWVPALVNTANAAVVRPDALLVYYKTGYNGISPSLIKPMPKGLRMIAGNAKATAGQDVSWWKCENNGAVSFPSIPTCPVGDRIQNYVDFPQCWDGVNLDSPNHKSHMAYPSGGSCPGTHPVPMPNITYVVSYPVTATTDSTRWRLASDMYSAGLPGGFSGHGDWINGWDQAVEQAWVTNCDVAAVDCHAHLLGDGRMIY